MKLSVITINYNNLAGLRKTVTSVIGQNCSDFEYIIIDGGSDDGSKEFMIANQQHFAYWISEKDEGIYHAMNKGIVKAKGCYLLFLNSGDYLFQSNTLKKVLPELDGTELVYGNMKIAVHAALKSGYMPRHITTEHMIKDTLWHPVTFVLRSLFLNYGMYSTNYKICGDYDFFLKVLVKEKVRAKHINQFISVFSMDGLSSDSSNSALIAEERLAIQKAYLSEKELTEYKSAKPKENWLQRIRMFLNK